MRSRLLSGAIIVLAVNLLGLLASSAMAQAIEFDYIGAIQNYTVPANTYALRLKMWSAGGACCGGSSAYVSGTLPVRPGQTLTVSVGGINGVSYGPGQRSYGGGGAWYGVSDVLAGGGGGCSVIFDGGNELVSVGAGGGGAYATNTGNYSRGGGGGILVGGSSDIGVTGGTQTEGGMSLPPYGITGEYLLGGNSQGRGAGGGSGHYGGGGGSQIGAKGLYGGGGGSSFIANLIDPVTEPGAQGSPAGMLPGGTSDPYYRSGIGTGGRGAIGSDGGHGGNGRIVIIPIASPVISSVSPESATRGSEESTITVIGSDFIPGVTVYFGATALETQFISSVQLQAVVPTSLLASAGSVAITVSNPGASSDAVTFTVNNPAPRLTTISPNQATAGSSATTIMLSGSKFFSDSVVKYGNTILATTFVSSTKLTAVIPTSLLQTAKLYTVKVFNPTPGGGTSSPVSFTVTSPLPTLASIDPTSVPAGSGDTVLVLTGTNFVNGSQLNFGTTVLPATYVSSTELRVTISSSLLSTPKTIEVGITNPSPSGRSNSVTFTVSNPVPRLTSISPNQAMAGSSAITITLNGIKFFSGSVAKYGNTILATTFVSSTKLTAIVPASLLVTAKVYTVKVFNPAPGGGTSSPIPFTVNNPVPTLTSISPASVAMGSGDTTAALTGTNLVNGSQVNFGGTVLSSTYVSSTEIRVTIPFNLLSTTRTVEVRITNPAPGGGTSNVRTFKIVGS